MLRRNVPNNLSRDKIMTTAKYFLPLSVHLAVRDTCFLKVFPVNHFKVNIHVQGWVNHVSYCLVGTRESYVLKA